MGMGSQLDGGGHYRPEMSEQFVGVSLRQLSQQANNEALQDLKAPSPVEAAQPTFDTESRTLVSLDRMARHQLPDGSFSKEFLEGDLQNLTTETQERGMPYSVSETVHEVAFVQTPEGRRRTFLWRLGKTAVQTSVEVAESGYKFHKHDSALQRVSVEVDEALHNDETLVAGHAKILISPRMTDKDAPRHVAEKEHLADDDAIRVTVPIVDGKGNIVARRMSSILVRDIPLAAWVKLLRSSDNIFGKSILVEDNGSALPVMQAFSELEIPVERLPEGPVSIIEAVLPHIDDAELRIKVNTHLENFRIFDQKTLEKQARNIALRQQQFNIELLASLQTKRATPAVEQFVFSLQQEWGADALELIRAHDLPDGGLGMSRKLAAMLSGSQQNILMIRAGVLSGNTKITKQMTVESQAKVYEEELRLQDMQRRGMAPELIAIRATQTNRVIAIQNVRGGAGCSGKAVSGFGGSRDKSGPGDKKNKLDELGNEIDNSGDSEDEETLEWEKGVCRIEVCQTRPGKTDVGPCAVCRHCQSLYDKGVDPTKFVNSRNEQVKSLGMAALFSYKKEELGLAA